MSMNNASDEDQLAAEGFVHVRSCPGCKLLRSEIKRLRARMVEIIALLEHQATAVDSGKAQALVVLKAAEVL